LAAAGVYFLELFYRFPCRKEGLRHMSKQNSLRAGARDPARLRFSVKGQSGESLYIRAYPSAERDSWKEEALFKIEMFKLKGLVEHADAELVSESIWVRRAAFVDFLSCCACGNLSSLQGVKGQPSLGLKGFRMKGDLLILVLLEGRTKKVDMKIPFIEFYQKVFKLSHLFNEADAWDG
jgi:hypothetical protein